MTVLRSGSASDVGLVRSTNQDLALETSSLFAVADGMGGHAGGEVASRLAIDALTAAFGRQPTGVGLADAVTSANAVVWAHSQENADLRGMGTTLTAVALVDEGGHDVLALVNVGDSRSYRFHDGELTQITKDHSLAEEMVLSGELTPAEAAFHPHRHILTRALGVSPDVDVDVWRIRPIRGERFLLCSDGLTNELGNNQLIEVLSTVADPQAAADLLVRAARTHGGSDNITAVVIDVIVGDEDTGSVPAVATMSPAFVDPTGLASDGVSTPQPLAVPEINIPNRRDRRRAKRRERRRDRGRRLITFRTLLFMVLFVAIVGAGYYSVRWYNTNSYYVGVNHNELVIYQGRIGGFLWYKPVEVQRTGVTTADVLATYLPEIEAGVPESTLAKAQNYVTNVRKTANPTTVLPTPNTTAPTTTTTTTVPGTP
ncbi:MAG TPA: Stp1/IreP family PP2C-type Ser/Thr phosphatase [Acidimicrobiales bacterium]|nr:Stp1/IreP family PP2C-type Ser/Thr phosphatase [Acidimicrobiales bacterium]